MSLTPLANYELSISEEELAKAVEAVSPSVNEWIKQVSKDQSESIIALCVLRGGCFFFADLLRRLDYSVQMEFIKFSSYNEENNTQMESANLKEVHFPFEFKDRIVLLVDDICESGRTLSILAGRLKELGARDVKTAVMVYRHVPNAQIAPDFFATEIRHLEWLVGMGLDDQGKFRNLPGIYTIKQS